MYFCKLFGPIVVGPTVNIRVKALICKNLKMTLYTQIYPAGHINLIFLILLHTRNRLGPVLAIHVMDDFDILPGYVAEVVHSPTDSAATTAAQEPSWNNIISVCPQLWQDGLLPTAPQPGQTPRHRPSATAPRNQHFPSAPNQAWRHRRLAENGNESTSAAILHADVTDYVGDQCSPSGGSEQKLISLCIDQWGEFIDNHHVKCFSCLALRNLLTSIYFGEALRARRHAAQLFLFG